MPTKDQAKLRGAQKRYRERHPDRVERYKAANREKIQAYHRKRQADPVISARRHSLHIDNRYGPGAADAYAEFFKQQGGKCAICGALNQSPEAHGKRLYLDHDHETGRFRGLLCFGCNVVLGHCDDSVDRLSKAIDYLHRGDS